MKKLFGTDGVRGVANVYPMTAEMAMQIVVDPGEVQRRYTIAFESRLAPALRRMRWMPGALSVTYRSA